MATSKMQSNIVTVRDTLVESQVNVSGVETWVTVQATYDFTSYKYLLINIQVRGAIMQSSFIPMDAFRNLPSTIPYKLSVTWDSGNLGVIALRSNGAVQVDAKTKNYAFVYAIYGLK